MSIYSKIIDIQKLGQAWDRVRKNKPAPGVDNVTYEMFDERRKEELRQLNIELSEHRYESLPVKLTDLYKGDKVRTIALFSMRDKVVQQSLANELGKIYEPLFSAGTYAYRPGQSALEAIKLIEDKITGQKNLWALKMDIRQYFDCISHERLLHVLEKRIREQDLLELIRAVIKAKVLDPRTGELKENEIGIYQGSSCAPLLSNIYLMDYDREMEKRCSFYIRYCDDILVLESTEEKARELFEYSRLYMERKGLELKENKTELHRFGGAEGFSYLGYQFTETGRSVPAKAVSSLTQRLETLWLTSGLPIEEKLKKGREILNGWEQYYRGERHPDSMIEYVILLTMVQNKSPEIRNSIENRRFEQKNYYKDIAVYMADYWKRGGNLKNSIREYEQFFQVPDEDKPLPENEGTEKYKEELIRCYAEMIIRSSEEICSDVMQLYTDLGEYGKASYFWEKKTEYAGKAQKGIPEEAVAAEIPVEETGGKTGQARTAAQENGNISTRVSIQDYMDLFVGREDTYARETYGPGNRRVSEQVPEPLTEEMIRLHLSGDAILGTYVQRPNGTSKYVVFDIDISKKILLQYDYGSPEFTAYKQNAAECVLRLCKTLKRMGLSGYIEDSGFRGYHVWMFFTDWIPVRYINQFTECIQKELGDSGDGITMEVFPDSGRIRAGKFGQKIRLPLGVHIRTGNRSFFVDGQFRTVTDYKKYFSGAAKCSLNALQKVIGMYLPETKEQKKYQEVDTDLEKFGTLPETVRIVLEKCSLMRYLCQKAVSTGYLSHFERMSVLHVFGHMGDEGREFVHTVMAFTLNYQYDTTEKFILKIPEKPISCIKLREQYKLITAEYGCSCNFKRTKNCYPSPVLHAIKNSDEETGITVPISRTISKAKEEKVYEELNIHKQTEKLAQRIIELKKQKRGLDRSVRKTEEELQKIFDNAGIDCLEIAMGLLVRRKKGEEYEWLIEL
ncbi:MAG: CRISPR-associated primase-polymerase type A1 [Blautia sp.]